MGGRWSRRKGKRMIGGLNTLTNVVRTGLVVETRKKSDQKTGQPKNT
jgi:hypothetical protein